MSRRALLVGGAALVASAEPAMAGLTRSTKDSFTFTDAGLTESRIPDVEVVTHTGRRARFLSDLVKDHVVLLNVFFTSCGNTCPLVTQNLIELQHLLADRIGRDMFMYSITLQPELETPEILRDYAVAHGIGPGWELLTGRPAEIEQLRRAMGFVGPDPAQDLLDDQHTGMLRYGSNVFDRWSASPALLPPTTLAKAIRNTMLVA